MTNAEILAIFVYHTKFDIRYNQAEESYQLGGYALWKEDEWLIGTQWSHYSSENGWDGGYNELDKDDGGGPHASLEDGLRVLCKLECKFRLDQAQEAVGEAHMAEHAAVVEVMDETDDIPF